MGVEAKLWKKELKTNPFLLPYQRRRRIHHNHGLKTGYLVNGKCSCTPEVLAKRVGKKCRCKRPGYWKTTTTTVSHTCARAEKGCSKDALCSVGMLAVKKGGEKELPMIVKKLCGAKESFLKFVGLGCKCKHGGCRVERHLRKIPAHKMCAKAQGIIRRGQ